MSRFLTSGLPAGLFQALFEMDDATLDALGARRVIAQSHPGYPCRISLEDAPIGEPVLLLNYRHQDEQTPFRASGPIYVRQSAKQRHLAPGEVTDYLRTRLLSVRAYNADHLMVDADVCEGARAVDVFNQLFDNPAVTYLHAHNARRGCFLCRIDRASE